MRDHNAILFVAKRCALLVPQLIGISVVTFLFLHLLPGNPAYLIAGSLASPGEVRAIEHHLGLDRPLTVQYAIYVDNVIHGDLGHSWLTGNAVLADLTQRIPATIELVSIALLLIAVLGIALGVVIARNPRGLIARVIFGYGLLAGALPDFWIGLILIFLLYYKLRLFPAPLGQLDIGVSAPRTITGMYLVDSLLTANWRAFGSSLQHLILPEITLVSVYMGLVVRMVASSMQHALRADYIRTARAAGLSSSRVTWHALRNALPPVLTVLGISYAYLLGGAVLVETIFSWGGIGQYAVQAVENSDYMAIEGFVLTAAVFTMLVYLLVDIGHFLLESTGERVMAARPALHDSNPQHRGRALGAVGLMGLQLWQQGALLLGYARRRPPFLLGLLITTGALLCAIIAPLIVPYDPTTATGDVLQAPSTAHLMGTDPTGMDILSRVLAASRVDLAIAIGGTLLSLVAGVVLGAAAGYWGGEGGLPHALSEGLLRIMDMIQAFPVFIFALALVSLSGPSARNVVIAIAFVNLPVFLRLARAAVLATREQLYIEAARSVGLGDIRILFRHVIPNSIEPALVNASVTAGAAILLTAGLSFIGAGIRPPAPEWGSIIATGSQYMITGQWWIGVFPGLALSLTVFGFALIGDGLREYLDPTKRGAFAFRSDMSDHEAS